MPMPRLAPRTALLTGAAAIILVSLPAAALSRRDQAAVDALAQRMQAAEARYAKAVVGMRNASPDAQKEGDAALEDMEDVMNACMRQRGCAANTMLTSYKRLLKDRLDAEDGDGDDDDDGAADYTPGNHAIATDVPEAARAARLLADDHRFDRMVEYNPAVQQGIRRWLTDMRPALMNSYENYQYMRHLMWPEFERAGLPEALLFGIMAKESNGKVHVGSRAGAVGPMQFMPATGRRFGLGDDGTGFDTRYDPRAAAQASASYLNERMRELNSNIEMALAAYNGGEGRALRVYRGSGGRQFWDQDVYAQFPAETQDYVPMVIAAAWLYLHPKEYGITFPRVSPKPASLRLAQTTSIYELTICLGNKGSRDGYMRTLRNLNPRFEATTPLAAGSYINATTAIVGLYNRWCTQGPRADLARMLVASDPKRAIVRTGELQPVAGTPVVAASAVPEARKAPARPAAPKQYRVQRGETLSSIARKFECSVDALARANDMRPARPVVRAGQTLKLDGCGG